MNKVTISLALLALVAVSTCEAGPFDDLYSQWTSFKAQYGKQYSGPAEEAQRVELLAQSKITVEEFNQERSEEAGYTLGINHLADRTHEEFKQLLGFKATPEQLSPRSDERAHQLLQKILSMSGSSEVPAEVDWRKSGRVSSVKNQGQCGSCWAFSTVGVLEGQEKPVKGTNATISLSPQNVMDCGTYAEAPCNGGNMQVALVDVAAQGGVEADADYPYETVGGDCRFNKSLSVIVNRDSVVLPATDEENLKKVVANYGPVAVAIEVSEKGNFRYYKEGVYSDEHCHNDSQYLNHGVLVVGYGTDKVGGDYWIVKNSWAASWGDQGYVKMARGKNMCGIGFFPVIASF